MSETIRVNGEDHAAEVDQRMPLLWFLRDVLELTGTKYSCGIGVCGACTVHIDGRAVRACLTPVSAAVGRDVTTIEGLSPDGSHPLQVAWLEHRVPQCGYCQAGQIMAAADFLQRNPDPTPGEIDEAMQGNLCRCGTYLRIRRAIASAARAMRDTGAA